MKKALQVLAAVALTSSVFAADGIITFNNRGYLDTDLATVMTGTTATSGGVMLSTGPGAGSLGAGAITVGLFKGTDTSVAPLATTTLRQNAGFEGVFSGTQDVTIPGVSVNSPAQLTIAAWSTSAGSFTAALTANNAWSGKATFTSLNLGGPNPPNPDSTPPGLTGFKGLVLTQVPEPSTYALAFSGVGALLLTVRRRK